MGESKIKKIKTGTETTGTGIVLVQYCHSVMPPGPDHQAGGRRDDPCSTAWNGRSLARIFVDRKLGPWGFHCDTMPKSITIPVSRLQ